MLLEQLLYSFGTALVSIPARYYLLLFILCMIGVSIVSLIFHFHIKKYTFRDYKTGMIRLVYIAGLCILVVIALVLLALIFNIS